jgi:hypothetical protein
MCGKRSPKCQRLHHLPAWGQPTDTNVSVERVTSPPARMGTTPPMSRMPWPRTPAPTGRVMPGLYIRPPFCAQGNPIPASQCHVAPYPPCSHHQRPPPPTPHPPGRLPPARPAPPGAPPSPAGHQPRLAHHHRKLQPANQPRHSTCATFHRNLKTNNSLFLAHLQPFLAPGSADNTPFDADNMLHGF